MKKIISVVLAVLMIAGMMTVFASCGKGSDFEKIKEKGEIVVPEYTVSLSK